MKRLVGLLILTGIILCTGSIAISPMQKSPDSIPNLLGNWSGSGKGYTEGTGYHDLPLSYITMSITDQKGRFFSGFMTYPLSNRTMRNEGFAGIISNDKKSFQIVEYDNHEHDDGWILYENEIEMVFMFVEEPQSILLYSLKRQP